MTKNIITTDDILGKDVVDTQGDILGVVQKLHIDKLSKSILGITVDQGFLKPDLFIGLQYIKQFGIDTIFLNTYPINKIKGLLVLDSNGKVLGHVSDFELSKNNQLSSINLKSGQYHEDITIFTKNIKEIGHNIVLREGFNVK